MRLKNYSLKYRDPKNTFEKVDELFNSNNHKSKNIQGHFYNSGYICKYLLLQGFYYKIALSNQIYLQIHTHFHSLSSFSKSSRTSSTVTVPFSSPPLIGNLSISPENLIPAPTVPVSNPSRFLDKKGFRSFVQALILAVQETVWILGRFLGFRVMWLQLWGKVLGIMWIFWFGRWLKDHLSGIGMRWWGVFSLVLYGGNFLIFQCFSFSSILIDDGLWEISLKVSKLVLDEFLKHKAIYEHSLLDV